MAIYSLNEELKRVKTRKNDVISLSVNTLKIIIVDQIPQEKVDNEYTAVALNVSVYDVTSGTWSKRQTSPEYTLRTDGLQTWIMRPIVAGATTGVYAPQKIYVLFGPNLIYVYDIVEDIWSINAAAVYQQPMQFIGCGVGVVDDILYAIGVTYTTSHGMVGTVQYVPFGHKDAVLAPEPITPTAEPTSPTTAEPSYSSDPAKPAKLSVTLQIAILVFALIIGSITGLFFNFKWKAKKK